MKREELETLGLSKEQIDTIMDINGKDINSVKVKMESVQEKLDKAHETIAERDEQLEAIKSSTGDINAMKQQVETLQAENQAAAEKYAAEMKEVKLSAAIKASLSGKVHDEDLTAAQFDKTKLILNEDGTVTGLQDQLQAIQTGKSFLFKTEEAKDKTGFKFGTDPNSGNNNQGLDADLKAAFGLEK